MGGVPPAGQARLGRFLEALQRAETALAVVAMLLVVAALVSDLAGRELLGQGIFGAQRFAVHATFVGGMLGFVVATGRGAHLRITATDHLVPLALAPLVERIGHVVSALILVALAWYAARFVAETWRIGERSVTLGIPIWPMQLALPYAFLSAALRYACYAVLPALKPAAPEGA